MVYTTTYSDVRPFTKNTKMEYMFGYRFGILTRIVFSLSFQLFLESFYYALSWYTIQQRYKYRDLLPFKEDIDGSILHFQNIGNRKLLNYGMNK